MRRPLLIEVSGLAKAQIRAAEEWWRRNRPAAPNAIREELERASWLIAVQPGAGAVARNVSLAGVRRLHLARIRYHLYYRVMTNPDRGEVLALWHSSRGSGSSDVRLDLRRAFGTTAVAATGVEVRRDCPAWHLGMAP